jgi:hypothetical protein
MIDQDYYNHLNYHLFIIILQKYLFELLTLHILNNKLFLHSELYILPKIIKILLFYSGDSYTSILIGIIV